jgi:hypothetical protein
LFNSSVVSLLALFGFWGSGIDEAATNILGTQNCGKTTKFGKIGKPKHTSVLHEVGKFGRPAPQFSTEVNISNNIPNFGKNTEFCKLAVHTHTHTHNKLSME